MTERPKVAGRAVLRAVAAVLAIGVWLGIAGVGGPTFGKLSEVQERDQAAFLPASAEATQALEWQSKFRDSEAIPAIVLIESDTAIDPMAVAGLVEALGSVPALDGDVSWPIPSEDGLALELIVPLTQSPEIEDDVAEVRDVVQENLPEGATGYVTGPAGFIADLSSGFAGIDGLLLLVALVAVLVILLIVYRSVLLPIIVLSTSVGALCAAILAVYWMAKSDWITLDGQSQGILSILVIGAATDYALLYVSRYREALMSGLGKYQATWAALRGSVEPILASAGTVIAGLLCLLFSDLNSNKALGPIAASGIVFAVLASLTLLPAALSLLGRVAFWPFMPKVYGDASDPAKAHKAGLWRRIADWVAKRPRQIWISTTVVLAVACIGVVQLNATGVPQSELLLKENESAQGQAAIARHFDAGAGDPAYVVASADTAADVLTAAEGTEGVASVYLLGEGGAPAMPNVPAAEVDGRVLVMVTLDDAPDSMAAEDTVIALREAVHEVDAETLVGGTTATALDTQTTAEADLVKIIPLILIAIMLILMLLLRSIMAPVVLIATTVLSYGAAMGISALVFRNIFDFPGADPTVPLFGFVFLVALGVDYNIFLSTRIREEALTHDPRTAITRGLAVTGGVITSAGVVLAATFAALGVIPIMFMVQLGFIVAFGVLLDTFVVRTLLVPAIAHELGRWMWWPSKIWRNPVSPAASTDETHS